MKLALIDHAADARDEQPKTLTRLVRRRDRPARPVEPPPKLRAYSITTLDQIRQLDGLSPGARFSMRVVASVLPFRVNQHVLDKLIDWRNVPDDPIFQLVFPQRGMLSEAHFERMASLLRRGAGAAEVRAAADGIRHELNPHPAGQMHHNVPRLDGQALPGMQHKYRETVLFFPAQGQTCHAYCTFCFRWAQFVGDRELKFASSDADTLVTYLADKPDVSDVLVTGGDPMVMKSQVFARYVDALLDPRLEHVRHVRIGSKALTFWPHRFVDDPDADELMRQLERLVDAGKHVAFMAHVNHWREIEPDITRTAIARIRGTGAVIRSQAPLLRHINDHADVWARMWPEQVKLGIVPYYMFVARDTGARRYFEVPLYNAWQIFRDAVSRVSGLCRTVRGPSMSAEPGKVEIQGVSRIGGEQVFVLRFVQARDASWVGRPFFAKLEPAAAWLDQLEPALGRPRFFFEPEANAAE